MADSRCPMCGKLNPAEMNACRYCGARLKPLQYGEAPSEPPSPPEGGGDWMSDLRGDMMRNRPKTSMLPPEPPMPVQSDDWLNKIEGGGSPASPAPTPPKRSAPLKRTAPPVSPPPEREEPPKRSAPPPSPQEASPDTPTWLSKVRAQVSAERQPAEPPEPANGEEDPVWLKRLRVRRTQDELASAPSPGPEPEPEAEPASSDELPAWLSKIRDNAPGETEAPVFGIPGGGTEEQSTVSPWGAPAPKQTPHGTESITGKDSEPEIPDWMQYPSGASGPTGGEPPVGTPDWMGSIASALEETPPTPATPESGGRPAGPVGRPPTGRLLGGQEAAEPGKGRGSGARRGTRTGNIYPSAQPLSEPFPPSSAAPGPSPFGSDWEFPAAPPTEFPFPNPAEDITVPSGSSAFLGGIEQKAPSGGNEDMPDWLEAAKNEPSAPLPPAVEEEPAVPTPDLNELLRPDAMPEWLHRPAETGKAEPGGGPAVAQPVLPENLEQAELPRWLEAMRPIQSVAVPAEDEERVESVGPLAGLRGVLSAEPVVAMPRRPGIMAGNIDALPAQLTLTETLRRLLIEPEVRAAHRPVRAMALAPVVRKVMSAVLLLGIILPLLTGPMFSNSVYQPQTNIQAGDLVAALPVDRLVLAAFEYDASSAPEIETGATVILEHLAQRGIHVVFISSQPNGTMLADGLLQLNQQMGMTMPELAADFGYVPGGAGGLRRLGGDLRSVIPDPALDWDSGPLSAIHAISDFSMILLFAANPQSVRNWVEQVHTSAPATPIVAMVSAASDALVFPYTQGSQPSLRGLVTGYTGAQAYRAHFLPATVPVEGVYAMRWQAYSSGILAILVTLFSGIIGSLVIGYIRKERRAAE
jgi:hypothetical protein